jgi:hypothetical protein
MKKTLFRITVALLTFSVGLSFVYFFYFQSNSEVVKIVALPEAQPETKVESEELDPWKLPEGFPTLAKGEFFLVGHGCGNGYVNGWLAYDGSRLSEGFDPINKKEFKEIVSQGTIIEKFENYPNLHGAKGQRVILKDKNQETGKEYYSILWFGKSQGKRFGMYYSNAPNLEVALELEQKLIKDQLKK